MCDVVGEVCLATSGRFLRIGEFVGVTFVVVAFHSCTVARRGQSKYTELQLALLLCSVQVPGTVLSSSLLENE